MLEFRSWNGIIGESIGSIREAQQRIHKTRPKKELRGNVINQIRFQIPISHLMIFNFFFLLFWSGALLEHRATRDSFVISEVFSLPFASFSRRNGWHKAESRKILPVVLKNKAKHVKLKLNKTSCECSDKRLTQSLFCLRSWRLLARLFACPFQPIIDPIPEEKIFQWNQIIKWDIRVSRLRWVIFRFSSSLFFDSREIPLDSHLISSARYRRDSSQQARSLGPRQRRLKIWIIKN